MFRFAVVILAVATSIHSAPQGAPAQAYSGQAGSSGTTPVAIISQTESLGNQGNFSYAFEAANGIKQNGSGFLKQVSVPKYDDSGKQIGEEPAEVQVQVGSYTYVDNEGNEITLTYIADENGFQPQGAHLPTPPSIPEEIVASLKQQAGQQQAVQQQNAAVGK